eukprot:7086999-Ditylum_brightwellii.AAC.1
MALLQKRYVLEFSHSDDASRFDINTHWICKVIVDDKTKEHVGRVWLLLTVTEQHDLVCKSNTVQKYKELHNDISFKAPGCTCFFENKYCCVQNPVNQSCITVVMSSLQHYMIGLKQFIA